jgi:lipopolysaccharide/colanic/teichoic acid biosynthesis glycosyltransferase
MKSTEGDNMKRKAGFYEKCIKRLMDLLLSLMALCVLSPVLLILIILGAIKMKGNPFFTQQRPGRNEKIFRLLKFRTMTCETDEKGNLLPDEQRLNKYGKLLRSTSLDELPELINIFIGDMSIVGPRPLLVRYLPRYSPEQRRRHDVRPGLTGWAQVNGRNAISWEDKFRLDVWYVDHISLGVDIKTIFLTVKNVLRREGISSETSATMEEFMGTPDKHEVSNG